MWRTMAPCPFSPILNHQKGSGNYIFTITKTIAGIVLEFLSQGLVNKLRCTRTQMLFGSAFGENSAARSSNAINISHPFRVPGLLSSSGAPKSLNTAHPLSAVTKQPK